MRPRDFPCRLCRKPSVCAAMVGERRYVCTWCRRCLATYRGTGGHAVYVQWTSELEAYLLARGVLES